MGFHELIDKVKQAETALEAQERQAAADWRQFRASWHALWTPGRIVLAGVAAGFMTGSTSPLRGAAAGRGLLQLATVVSGLFASGSAQAAANEAEHAAEATAAPAAAAFDPERLYREAGLP